MTGMLPSWVLMLSLAGSPEPLQEEEKKRYLTILDPASGEDDKESFHLKVLTPVEVLKLLPYEICWDWWSSEGVSTVRIMDDRHEKILRRWITLIDREECTPRREVKRDAFAKVVSEGSVLLSLPDAKVSDEPLDAFIKECEAIARDKTAAPDSRMFAALLAIRGYWRLTREAIVDLTRARILKPALAFCAEAESIEGAEDWFSFLLARRKGGILSVSDRRKDSIDHYEATLTRFKAFSGWQAYTDSEKALDRLKKGD